MGQNAGISKVIVDDKIVHLEDLKNTTYVNLQTRIIRQEELFLNTFLLFQNNLQCISPARFKLNGVETDCDELEVVKLNENFELEYGGHLLTSFHLQSKRNHHVTKEWNEAYQFNNLPESFIPFENDEVLSVISPILDSILLDSTGSFHPYEIGFLSSGFVLICLISCCVLFYKCPRFRNFL